MVKKIFIEKNEKESLALFLTISLTHMYYALDIVHERTHFGWWGVIKYSWGGVAGGAMCSDRRL